MDIFTDESAVREETGIVIPKNKIIFFYFLAACVPSIIENLLTPALYDIMARNIHIPSSVMAGAGTLISCLAAVIRLVFLILGGYKITHSKAGTVRFAGIFMFSVAIASNIIGIFSFLDHMPPSYEVIVAWVIHALKVIGAVIAALISVKLFCIFEYRTENRCVNTQEASLFRKKLIIFLIVVYALTFVTGGVVPYFGAMLGNTMEAVQPILYIISILASLTGILMLYLIYRFSYSVRNVKADAIGFGGVYYIAGALTSPVTLLLSAGLKMLVFSEIGNSVAIIQGFITMAVSLASTIAGFFIMFTALKIFFPVKEELVPEPAFDPVNRSEEILRNLIESEKKSETEE